MGTTSRLILKQAYRLTRGKKALWVASLFLVWPNLVIGLAVLYWLVLSIQYKWQGATTVQIQNNDIAPANPVLAITVIVLAILLFFAFYRAKAYVALMIKELKMHIPGVEMKKWEESGKYTGSLMSLSFGLMTGLAVFVSGIGIPVNNLIAQGYSSRAFTLGIIGVILFSPILGILYLGMTLTPLFNVVYQLSLWDSMRVSIDVSRRLWRGLLIFFIKLFVIQTLGLAASIALMFITILPFVLLIQLFYDNDGSNAPGWLLGLAGTAGFVVFFMSQAIIAMFCRVAWAVLFFEIIRPMKTEQLVQEEAVPETVPTE